MKDSMTDYFEGGVLSFHKPHPDVPCTHSTPLIQEKALLEHEKFPTNVYFKNDALISPETAGTSNQCVARFQSSQETILQFPKFISNFNITLQNLF
jgi:hypothetical protein